ncbi:TPA: serine hydrolase [Legionella pneumophila]|uniref:Serine hydrolase n=1 Tax=Legionella pneumophila TaxID=446 RepID=A0AAP3HED7_LEGPN|nr:serine hydrolase [Legionella pneumophila]HAT9300986.1 serine hydrolase [Legionella pneumophila subsp. pneumophila]MCO1452108.1 serine hydrolase [Legionella pneumophila]MCZ4692346.1 serine hydrolase [Legionella pneumophila]MCZ4711471.1 serine hydrolase [Legionella pneumophila]MCZ4719876.1 serine hydrolase [Legionella pneumophila]
MSQTKIDKSNLIEKSDVESVRKEANISQVSVATVTSSGSPVTHGYGDMAVEIDTIFGAASLSKPVFAYLVLKLVETGKLTLDMKGLNDILPFKTFCEQHGFKWKNEEINEEDITRINAFTPAMILSHKTGFDLNNRTNEVNHQFEPGQEYYRYSGLPLFYLQKVIEKLHEPQLALMSENDSFKENKLYVSINPPNLKYTIFDLTGVGISGTIDLKDLNCNLQKLTDIQDLNPYLPKILEEVAKRGHTSNLEVLAKKYVFDPLQMHHSSFGGKPCAANSLITTTKDYALFVQAWMNDEKLQYAFKPQISMTKDPWAQEVVPDKENLKYVAECLGFQLEVDENGKPLTAFKTGDMGPWRGWVAIDLNEDIKQRRATVYFAKGPESDGNGHILAETLMDGYQLRHGLYWFKEKYGFATGLEKDWETSQKVRCARGMEYQDKSPRLPKLEEEVTESIDSTQKMFQIMPPRTKLTLKTVKSEEQEANSNKPIPEVEVRKEGEIQEERKFNPTPRSTFYDPYK